MEWHVLGEAEGREGERRRAAEKGQEFTGSAGEPGWMSESREHGSPCSQRTLKESFATSDERWKEAVIQTSGSIYPDASPPLQRLIQLLLSFQRTV